MQTKNITDQTMTLGGWRFQPMLNRLVNGKRELRLEPKMAAVLKVLADKPGEPVTRKQVLMEAWGHDHVTDDALNRIIGKLRRQLGEAAPALLIETLPKVGYRLVLKEKAPRSNYTWLITAIFILVAATLAWLQPWSNIIGTGSNIVQFSPAATPVTSLPGVEATFSFADQGSAITFAHKNPGHDWRLYQTDGRQPPQPITEESGVYPRWSPDQSRLAFIRRQDGQCQVMLREGSQIHPLTRCRNKGDNNLSWTPQSDALVYSAATSGDMTRLALYNLTDGSSRMLTDPPPGSIGDAAAAISPDGRQMAFIRWMDVGVGDIHILDMRTEQLRRITHDELKIHGLTWVSNDQLVYASNRTGYFGLWSIKSEDGALAALPVAGRNVANPQISPDGNSLVYEDWLDQTDIMQMSLTDGIAHPLIDSSRWDWSGARSPDGEKLAFVSDRNGAANIWLANGDGAAAIQITHFNGPYISELSWSPDSTRLAFAVADQGSFNIYQLQAADNQTPIPVADSAVSERAPRWSADGETLYFGRKQGEYWQLMRYELQTRQMETVQNDATVAEESTDGRWLYFSDCSRSGLWRKSLLDHSIEQIAHEPAPLDCYSWQLTDQSIYLIGRTGAHEPHLHRLDLETLDLTSLAPVPNYYYWSSGLQVRDGHLLFSSIVQHESDLMRLQRVQ